MDPILIAGVGLQAARLILEGVEMAQNGDLAAAQAKYAEAASRIREHDAAWQAALEAARANG